MVVTKDSGLQDDLSGVERKVSFDILKEYESKFPQIKIIKHDKNKGLSAARNTGIKNAVGKYIQFIDSDDMIKPETFRKLYALAEDNTTDVIYFNMEFLNDEENNLVRKEVAEKNIVGIHTGREMFCLYQMMNTAKVEAWRQFIRRDFLLESQILFKEGIIHEDILFSFLLAMEAKRVIDYNERLYVYRQRVDSISWSQKHKSAASWFVCLLNICNYWLSHEFLAEEDKWISIYIEKICTTYKGYKEYQGNMESVGNYKERLMYDIVYDRYSSVVEFSDNQIERLKTSDMNIIYGAGKVASEVLKLMKKNEVSINYIAVTRAEDNATSMDGIEVKSIEELSNFKDGIVILGTDRKWHDEIISFLNTYDFENYIVPKFK